MAVIPIRPRERAHTGITLPGELTRTDLGLHYGDDYVAHPFVDVRKFGVSPDCDLATGIGTNWAPQLQAAVDELPPGVDLYFPPPPYGFGYCSSEVDITRGIGVASCGTHTYLVPHSSIDPDKGIINFLLDADEPSNFNNHMQRPGIRNIAFSGLDRTVPCHAITLQQCDRGDFTNVYIEQFDGSGMKHNFSCREHVYNHVQIRFCGTDNVASLDLEDSDSLDGHNNLKFIGCQVVYGRHHHIKIRDAGSAAGGIRGIKFTDLMCHGDEDWGSDFSGAPLILVDGAGPVWMAGERLHSSGPGHPLAIVMNGGVFMTSMLRMGHGGGDYSATGISVASNVFSSTAHRLTTGALINVTGAGLAGTEDRWVIRLTDDTYSVATSYANAVAGTVATVSNDTGVSVATEHIGIDTVGTGVRATMSDSYATPSFDYRAAIINRTGDATRCETSIVQGVTTAIETA